MGRDARAGETSLRDCFRGKVTFILTTTALVLALTASAQDAPAPGEPSAAEHTEDLERVAARIPQLETGLEQDHLTGNWGGWRTRLVERGFHLQSGYAGEVFSNLNGGLDEGTEFEGLWELGLNVDPSQFSAWRNAAWHLAWLYPHGKGLSAERVGNLATLSNIDADDEWTLFELWLEQSFWQERVAVRLGQLSADQEFAVTDYGGALLNSTFGWPAFLGENVPSPSYPLGAPGVRLHLKPFESFHLHAAVFDGDVNPPDSLGHPSNPHGLRVNLNGEEGAFTMGELAWRPNAGGLVPGQPATFKLGGWYHSGRFDSLHQDDSGLPLTDPASSGIPDKVQGNWGGYLVVDQRLWSETPEDPETADTDQGLSLFTRIAAAPRDRSQIEFYADGGFHYKGLWPGRDQDLAVVGFAYLKLSEDLRNASAVPGEPRLDYEMIIEATYQVHLKPWWTLQPDLQYVIHPGGSTEIPNALVLGARLNLVF